MKRTILVLSLFAASMASAQVAEELVPAKTNNFTSVEMPIGEVEELV